MHKQERRRRNENQKSGRCVTTGIAPAFGKGSEEETAGGWEQQVDEVGSFCYSPSESSKIRKGRRNSNSTCFKSLWKSRLGLTSVFVFPPFCVFLCKMRSKVTKKLAG
mmetsp:Transcript_39892/g.45505  ORF Transcript_39892/g.45505 Transcript_39892/m.45505 type:complete len:108 (-) Transcript_39892:2123-2446(-)